MAAGTHPRVRTAPGQADRDARRARQARGFQTSQTLVAGWKFPTGADDRTGPDGSRLPPGEQPGTGRQGIEIGYAFDRERLVDTFWASGFYHHELGDGFRTGDMVELDAGYGRWVSRPNLVGESRCIPP